MTLSRAERFARIDALEAWGRALWQVQYGSLVLTLVFSILGGLLMVAFGLLIFCLIRLAEKLVHWRVRLHTRKLGLTKG